MKSFTFPACWRTLRFLLLFHCNFFSSIMSLRSQSTRSVRRSARGSEFRASSPLALVDVPEPEPTSPVGDNAPASPFARSPPREMPRERENPFLGISLETFGKKSKKALFGKKSCVRDWLTSDVTACHVHMNSKIKKAMWKSAYRSTVGIRPYDIIACSKHFFHRS